MNDLLKKYFGYNKLKDKQEEIINNVIPTKLINKSFSISEFNLNYLHRFDTYKNTILFILQKPIFGWGASTFTVMYFLKSKISLTTHTHNIFLEVKI